MAKRAKGTGSVFRRAGTSMLWLKYTDATGKIVQESAETSDRRKALAILRTRTARVTLGERVRPKDEKLMVGELYADYVADCRVKHLRDIEHIESRWKHHLAPVFASVLALDVSKAMFTAYAAKRQAAGIADATVNRELSIVRRAFYLAQENEKLRHIPSFLQLKEDNARQGHLSDEQYKKLAAECGRVGLWLRTLFELGCVFSWRKGELVGTRRGKGQPQDGMRVSQVDLLNCNLHLRAEQTKTGEARTVSFEKGSNVYHLLAASVAGKKADDFVFTREDGKPVKDFRKTWKKVCERAGVPDLLFHDLRRTGVTNMLRDGLSEHEAMTVSGHKTNAMLQRYDITKTDARRKEIARKMEQGRAARLATVSATVAPEVVHAENSTLN